MKKYIYILLSVILFWLWFTKTADIALSVHNRAYDVDVDFKSITWLSKEKFEIKVETDGRIHRMLGKETFVYSIYCKEIR